MRQHLAERGAAARAQTDEQRALKPAAMLVAAFEIHVGRPGQLRPDRQHRLVARTRVEPHVENVHLALEASCRRSAGQVSPGGTNSSVGRSYHASAPSCSKTAAACSTIAGDVIASPHAVQSSAGIGTPHARWREMHQSGRFATML